MKANEELNAMPVELNDNDIEQVSGGCGLVPETSGYTTDIPSEFNGANLNNGANTCTNTNDEANFDKKTGSRENAVNDNKNDKSDKAIKPQISLF